MEASVVKKTKDGDAYFTVCWSKLSKADKYEINASVPAQSGILELYYKDDSGRMKLMYISRVWFGGLRSTLRKITDPELEIEPAKKDILTRYTCYYRYTLSSSNMDMRDVLFYFSEVLFPGEDLCGDSGRYGNIYLLEESPDEVATV